MILEQQISIKWILKDHVTLKKALWYWKLSFAITEINYILKCILIYNITVLLYFDQTNAAKKMRIIDFFH